MPRKVDSPSLDVQIVVRYLRIFLELGSLPILLASGCNGELIQWLLHGQPATNSYETAQIPAADWQIIEECVQCGCTPLAQITQENVLNPNLLRFLVQYSMDKCRTLSQAFNLELRAFARVDQREAIKPGRNGIATKLG